MIKTMKSALHGRSLFLIVHLLYVCIFIILSFIYPENICPPYPICVYDIFPSITLGHTVDHWFEHEFVKKRGAKCLILIGPRRTGKTTFALSLPGQFHYFTKHYSTIKTWNNYARYSIYDDVPWDEFEQLAYPEKTVLLTQSGRTLTVCI